MIDIGGGSFHIKVENLAPDELEAFSTSLFDRWEKDVENGLLLTDYALSLRIEEGSVKGVGKIAAGLGALYIAIGQYGSFVNGLQTIHSQVASVSSGLADSATNELPQATARPKIRTAGGTLAKLQTLFKKVQNRKITIDEAMEDAARLLGDESARSPEFMDALQSALEEVPRFPEQMSLPYELPDEEIIAAVRPPQVSKAPKPRPAPPPIEHYRIDIWRDSKKTERHVNVTKF